MIQASYSFCSSIHTPSTVIEGMGVPGVSRCRCCGGDAHSMKLKLLVKSKATKWVELYQLCSVIPGELAELIAFVHITHCCLGGLCLEASDHIKSLPHLCDVAVLQLPLLFACLSLLVSSCCICSFSVTVSKCPFFSG